MFGMSTKFMFTLCADASRDKRFERPSEGCSNYQVKRCDRSKKGRRGGGDGVVFRNQDGKVRALRL